MSAKLVLCRDDIYAERSQLNATHIGCDFGSNYRETANIRSTMYLATYAGAQLVRLTRRYLATHRCESSITIIAVSLMTMRHAVRYCNRCFLS